MVLPTMKNNMSLEGLLGLARRAGKLALGKEAVESALTHRKVYLLIVAQDASQSTIGKLEHRAVMHSVPCLHLDSRDELGRLMGRDTLAVVGLLDPSFARGILKILEKSPNRPD